MDFLTHISSPNLSISKLFQFAKVKSFRLSDDLLSVIWEINNGAFDSGGCHSPREFW